MNFQGMDVETARASAEQMRGAEQALTQRLEELDSRISGLDAWWRGPDAEHFAQTWHARVKPRFRDAVEGLGQCARELEGEADQQEETSSADGHEAGEQGGGGGRELTMLDDTGGAPVDPDVARAWREMEPEEQRAVLQQIVDEEFERYDMEPVEIQYFYEPPHGRRVTLGAWTDETGTLKLNTVALDSTALALAAAHEVRHAAQSEMVRRTEPGFWDFLPFVDSAEGEYEKIEEEYGITREEIEAWRENSKPGNYIPSEEDFEEYEAQPLEYDARERRDEYAESLTFDELQRLQREAGVPESEKPR